MKWVMLPVQRLAQKEIANLPDALWRLLMEYDLLCGRFNGSLKYDPAEIAWLLHREEDQVAVATTELLNMGLLVLTEEGMLLPTDWLARHTSYLAKLAYNRERYHHKETGEDDVTTVEEDWDTLPSGGGLLKPTQAEAIAALRSDDPERRQWQRWAAGDRCVRNAPENIQHASWLLLNLAGIAPYGSGKSWATAVCELLAAAGNNWEVLTEAIRKAVNDRNKHDITLSGPRSFLGYARGKRSQMRLAAQQQADGSAAIDTTDDHPTVEVEL